MTTQDRHRKFLMKSLDDDVAPMLSKALRGGFKILSDGQWHPWKLIWQSMVLKGGVAEKTSENLMYKLQQAGFIEKRGQYVRGADTREVKIKDWPVWKS